MSVKHCVSCGARVHPDRIAYGWRHCVACVADDWSLIDRPAVIIHTSHKQGPMVVRPDLYDGESAYDRG